MTGMTSEQRQPPPVLSDAEPPVPPERATRRWLRTSENVGAGLFWAVALVVVLVWPAVGDAYSIGLGTSALILVLLALSWNVIGGFAGELSFGQAAFFGVGAYTAAIIATETELEGMMLVVLCLVAAAMTGAVASLAFVPALRSRGAYFAILTLAVAEVAMLIARRVMPGRDEGLVIGAPYGRDVTTPFAVAAVLVGLGVLATIAIRRSSFGLALDAVRHDREAAASVGVATVRVRLAAFAISTAMAAVAGAAYGLNQGYVDPQDTFGIQYSILPVLMVILGGIRTTSGAVLGAILWFYFNNWLTSVSPDGRYTTLVYGFFLVVLAVLLKDGLVGLARSAFGKVARQRGGERQ
jgi:branched-chain amino acid transport system permease protein